MKIQVEDYNLDNEEELMTTIATFLRERRQQLNITQEGLSILANVQRTHIAQIETGLRKGVTIKFLSRVMDALETDLILRPREI